MLLYIASMLFLVYILSGFVRNRVGENTEITYLLISPFAGAALFALPPFIFPALGNMLFNRPTEELSCGNAMLPSILLQFIFVGMFTPAFAGITYYFNKRKS